MAEKRSECPKCRKRLIKIGRPVWHPGGFIDQILICSKCDWSGVDTEIDPDPDRKPEPEYTQIKMEL